MEKPPDYDEATRSGYTSTDPSGASDVSQSPSSNYALISIARSDRVRLLWFPEYITEGIADIFRSCWPRKIQHVKLVADHLEIKLRGNPFSYACSELREKNAIRNCFLRIFNVLAREGWGLHPALGGLGRVGIYTSTGEKDCIVFQRQPPQRLAWICVSFSAGYSVDLMNTPAAMGPAIIEYFGDRLEKCRRDIVSGNLEIKFRHGPWPGALEYAASSRLNVVDFMRCLEAHGYALCASLDLDDVLGSNAHHTGFSTWFCCRPSAL